MHVLKIHKVKLDYQALATAMGNDVTPKAITHRIAKLRSMAEEQVSPHPGQEPGTPIEPSKKRGPSAPVPRTPTLSSKDGGRRGNGGRKDTSPPSKGVKRTASGNRKSVGLGAFNGGEVGGSPLSQASGVDDADETGGEETEGTASKKAKLESP
ncbi:MAG: hypothetical protein Q9217_002625 [Psora testacea]